jgi:hypothetical protein
MHLHLHYDRHGVFTAKNITTEEAQRLYRLSAPKGPDIASLDPGTVLFLSDANTTRTYVDEIIVVGAHVGCRQDANWASLAGKPKRTKQNG